jgi:hypothetical protein
MSVTKPITIDADAPGTQTFTYEVNGVPPNLSTGWTSTMRFWRAGISSTLAAEYTATQASGITLGTLGAITVNYVIVDTGLDAVSSLDANWHYTLALQETGYAKKQILSGPFIRMQP